MPLGRYVGNSLEVYEAIMCLRGEGDERLMEVSKSLAAHMVVLAGKANDVTEALGMVEETVNNGSAIRKLVEFVTMQGGDAGYIIDPSLLPKGEVVVEYKAKKAGYIYEIQTELIGKACLCLGGGRRTKEDIIDPGVGLYLNKKIGEYVEEGQTIATIYASDMEKAGESFKILEEAYVIFRETSEGSNKIIKCVI